jgi:hypothetical protein
MHDSRRTTRSCARRASRSAGTLPSCRTQSCLEGSVTSAAQARPVRCSQLLLHGASCSCRGPPSPWMMNAGTLLATAGAAMMVYGASRTTGHIPAPDTALQAATGSVSAVLAVASEHAGVLPQPWAGSSAHAWLAAQQSPAAAHGMQWHLQSTPTVAHAEDGQYLLALSVAGRHTLSAAGGSTPQALALRSPAAGAGEYGSGGLSRMAGALCLVGNCMAMAGYFVLARRVSGEVPATALTVRSRLTALPSSLPFASAAPVPRWHHRHSAGIMHVDAPTHPSLTCSRTPHSHAHAPLTHTPTPLDSSTRCIQLGTTAKSICGCAGLGVPGRIGVDVACGRDGCAPASAGALPRVLRRAAVLGTGGVHLLLLRPHVRHARASRHTCGGVHLRAAPRGRRACLGPLQ